MTRLAVTWLAGTRPAARWLTVLGVAALTLAAALPAQAQSPVPAAQAGEAGEPAGYRLGDMTISEVWSHQSASRDGAAYLRIGNAGADDDALIDASTPVAKRVELRGPLPGGRLWETARVNAIPAPARRVAVLAGTGLRLKLVGLRGLLSVGGTVPITLTFERAGAITVRARVLSPNAAAAMIERTAPRQTAPQHMPPGRPAAGE